MTSHRKNKSKASKGGLTSPTLYDSGLDFPNRGRKKHRRTAGANQLHKCHKWLVKCRIYITPESVADLSHIKIRRESSVAKMFYRISCTNVTVARMSHITIRRLSSGKFVTLQKYHTWVRIGPIAPESPQTPPVEISQTPPSEN